MLRCPHRRGSAHATLQSIEAIPAVAVPIKTTAIDSGQSLKQNTERAPKNERQPHSRSLKNGCPKPEDDEHAVVGVLDEAFVLWPGECLCLDGKTQVRKLLTSK